MHAYSFLEIYIFYCLSLLQKESINGEKMPSPNTAPPSPPSSRWSSSWQVSSNDTWTPNKKRMMKGGSKSKKGGKKAGKKETMNDDHGWTLFSSLLSFS